MVFVKQSCCAFNIHAGMTQNQQVGVLEQFREGDHKLLVATSVAQEGLDIAECNVVVQYNCISNVVAHVQARGKRYTIFFFHFLFMNKKI